MTGYKRGRMDGRRYAANDGSTALPFAPPKDDDMSEYAAGFRKGIADVATVHRVADWARTDPDFAAKVNRGPDEPRGGGGQ